MALCCNSAGARSSDHHTSPCNLTWKIHYNFQQWTKHSKHSRSWEKNCTGAAMNCNMKSGCCRAKNDCLEMASEKTDPKRLTRPLDTNKYTTINYSTNTLKYIPHARQTNIQNPKGQKQKTLINRCFVLYIHSLPFFTLTGSSEEDIPVALHVGQQTKVLPTIMPHQNLL